MQRRISIFKFEWKKHGVHKFSISSINLIIICCLHIRCVDIFFHFEMTLQLENVHVAVEAYGTTM